MSSSTEGRTVVGRIGKPHGVRGGVTVVTFSDAPERFRPGARFRTNEESLPELTVAEVRPLRAGGLVVRFQEVTDRTMAEGMRGWVLTIRNSERRPLGDGEYWPEQLTGLQAVAPDGTKLGLIRDVIAGPAQDRLVVEVPDGRTVEVPFVDALVPEVSIGRGTATIVPLEGLFS